MGSGLLNPGPPRPVEIEVPPDTLAEALDVELLEPAMYARPEPPSDSIAEAARLLAENDGKVLIWAGGGANSEAASVALTRLAERLQAPVFTTGEGKGAISDRHYLSLGSPRGREEAMQRVVADHPVVLAVGTRLATANLPEGHRVVQIDVDPEEIGRNWKDTLPVLGDATLSLERLHEAVSGLAGPSASRQAEFEAFRAARFDPANLMEPQGSFMRAIRNALPEDGIFVSGMTQIGYFSRAYYPVYKPGTYITSSYSGNLGFAFPTALGAKVARPDTPVVCVSGDGGFMYNVQELATAVQYGINTVTVVFNDNAYGNVLREQVRRFNDHPYGAELHNPDFVRMAESFGARGLRVDDADALETAIRESIAIEAPTLIEVPVGMMESSF
ncbi:MAG: thiamine pyrophosphate-dependent enzyme [Chloroflexota bacterium]|nr:thiamine pyrophosphate-dependent enzyme [Chloroflexota bacterium]